jgi:hypothetical protein
MKMLECYNKSMRWTMFLDVTVFSYKFYTVLLFTKIVLFPAEQKTVIKLPDLQLHWQTFSNVLEEQIPPPALQKTSGYPKIMVNFYQTTWYVVPPKQSCLYSLPRQPQISYKLQIFVFLLTV